MCGRFVSTTGPADLASHFGAESITGDLPPRWNIAPTARVWVVHETDSARVLDTMRWGLVPSWAKDPSVGNRMFNARAETVTQRPAYRAAARKRRCVVPADGFYEWAPTAGTRRKQPWYFHAHDGAPLALAGLWETWQGGDGADAVHTCTVVTTGADDVVGPVHDRMPAILSPGTIDRWLSPDVDDPHEVEALLAGNQPPTLTAHPVGTEVNNARNSGPHLVAPLIGLLDDNSADNTGGSDGGDNPRRA
jgi:putative SOS response-associated peptidase YedK